MIVQIISAEIDKQITHQNNWSGRVQELNGFTAGVGF